MIRILVDAGTARDVTLCFNTNGTIARPRWLELATEFKQLNLWISIDGKGPHYEYIRHPGRWSRLIENVAGYRAIANAHVSVSVTAQAYNALHLPDLFRYFDAQELPFGASLLHYPRYLQPTVLSPSVRRVASARLRAYAAECASEVNRGTAVALASELDSAGDAIDREQLRQLMLFTNDLDEARGQSLAALEPELITLLEKDGVPWIGETVHAARRSARREG